MKDQPPYPVSEIANGLYCEQKAAFDRKHGRPTRHRTRYRRADEAFAAMCAEQDDLHAKPVTQSSESDRRCFIASVVFGPDAPQTQALRLWRDRTLMRNRLGRRLVSAYYVLSRRVLPLLEAHPFVRTFVRSALSIFIRILR